MRNPVTGALRAVDRLQKRHRWLAVTYAVLEGRTQSLEEVVSASKDEFVEVEEGDEAK